MHSSSQLGKYLCCLHNSEQRRNNICSRALLNQRLYKQASLAKSLLWSKYYYFPLFMKRFLRFRPSYITSTVSWIFNDSHHSILAYLPNSFIAIVRTIAINISWKSNFALHVCNPSPQPRNQQPVVDYNVRCNPAGIRYFARWKNCKWRLPEHPCCPQNKDKPIRVKRLSFKK